MFLCGEKQLAMYHNGVISAIKWTIKLITGRVEGLPKFISTLTINKCPERAYT